MTEPPLPTTINTGDRRSWGLGITLASTPAAPAKPQIHEATARLSSASGLASQPSLIQRLTTGLYTLLSSGSPTELRPKTQIEDMLETYYQSQGRAVPHWVSSPPADPPLDTARESRAHRASHRMSRFLGLPNRTPVETPTLRAVESPESPKPDSAFDSPAAASEPPRIPRTDSGLLSFTGEPLQIPATQTTEILPRASPTPARQLTQRLRSPLARMRRTPSAEPRRLPDSLMGTPPISDSTSISSTASSRRTVRSLFRRLKHR
ncbi:hypothetical protein EC988_007372 [Linderina pennispora]|nr:hypothetical protein EC988_007372 [Linderina pennispora]